ncbi:MAG: hypothetical protein Q8Q36_01755 [bacterium]|nr:hypothetical protein [bacterium]
MAIGGGAGLLASILGVRLWDLFGGQEDAVNARSFDGFKIVEKGKELRVYSRKGEEIFVIDNEKL